MPASPPELVSIPLSSGGTKDSTTGGKLASRGLGCGCGGIPPGGPAWILGGGIGVEPVRWLLSPRKGIPIGAGPWGGPLWGGPRGNGTTFLFVGGGGGLVGGCRPRGGGISCAGPAGKPGPRARGGSW